MIPNTTRQERGWEHPGAPTARETICSSMGYMEPEGRAQFNMSAPRTNVHAIQQHKDWKLRDKIRLKLLLILSLSPCLPPCCARFLTLNCVLRMSVEVELNRGYIDPSATS